MLRVTPWYERDHYFWSKPPLDAMLWELRESLKHVAEIADRFGGIKQAWKCRLSGPARPVNDQARYSRTFASNARGLNGFVT
jgi:hypothetical protein